MLAWADCSCVAFRLEQIRKPCKIPEMMYLHRVPVVGSTDGCLVELCCDQTLQVVRAMGLLSDIQGQEVCKGNAMIA